MADAILVDGYRDFTLIAAGPRTSLYRAHQTADSRRVAFKIWSAPVLDDGDRASLRRHWQVAQVVSGHPSIVTVLDAGFTSERWPFMVFDYMDGPSAGTRLADGWVFDTSEVLGIGVKLVRALAAVHAGGLLHLSVNPSHVMLSRGGALQLADLGSSAVWSRLGGRDASAAPDRFTAPELSNGDATEAADVYSLGATLSELLSSDVRAGHRADMGALNDRPVDSAPPSRRPEWSGPLDAILRRAQAERRSERYETMAVMARDLEHARHEMGLPPVNVPLNGSHPGDVETASLPKGLDNERDITDAPRPPNGPGSTHLYDKPADEQPPRRRRKRALLLVGAAVALIGLSVSWAVIGQSGRREGGASQVPASTSPAPTAPASAQPAQGVPIFNSISCPTASFCVAVDDLGNALIYDGTRWTPTDSIDSGLTSVSCPTTTFCAAVDVADSVTLYNGKAWSRPETIDPLGGVNDVLSCPTTTFCVAFDADGAVILYNGKGWSQPVAVDPFGAMQAVSCPTAHFCVAVDGGYDSLFTYNGRTWSERDVAYPLSGLGDVSCPTTTFCVAVDGGGDAVYYRGTTWSQSQVVESDGLLIHVSCPTTTFCAAVDQRGQVLTYNGKAWSQPQTVDPVGGQVEPGGIEAVSCPTADFCAAVGYSGTAVIYRNGAWSQAESIEATSP
jgi:serine/threonine protein kinase